MAINGEGLQEVLTSSETFYSSAQKCSLLPQQGVWHYLRNLQPLCTNSPRVPQGIILLWVQAVPHVMMATMEVTTEVASHAEEADNKQATRTQSGGARHVTILMAVGFPTDKISPTLTDGATATTEAVAVDGVLIGNQDPDTGDTTEVTGTAESTVAADLLPDFDEDVEGTGEVDFGWGIDFGNLSPEDLKQIASFPEMLAMD